MSGAPANAAWQDVPVLRGRHVVLEPLQAAHVPALQEAVADGVLSGCWYTNVPAAEAVER